MDQRNSIEYPHITREELKRRKIFYILLKREENYEKKKCTKKV